jgi:phenylpropionate dioxygenase-like ring-hydroxylating dioxygenase large terminal subunit
MIGDDAPLADAARAGRRGASHRGAPEAAWYPVCRAVRKQAPRRVSLHGHVLTVDQSGPQAVLAGRGGEGWQATTALGMVWVRRVDGVDEAAVPPLPAADLEPDMVQVCYSLVRVATDYDQAVLGLVDPAHVPMVHNSWWWRSDPVRKVKTKHYTPSPFGFTAVSCDAFASAPVYDLVGHDRSVSIEFRLPSARVETVRSKGFRLCNLTTVTPEVDGRIALRNLIFCNQPLLVPARPVLSWLGRRFLSQDAVILETLDSEADTGRPLFAGAPDQPSLWYYACKRALLEAQGSGRAFDNPVAPSILRWRT